jgi:hypothetical protein
MVRIPLAAGYGSLPSEPVIGAKQGNDRKWPEAVDECLKKGFDNVSETRSIYLPEPDRNGR